MRNHDRGSLEFANDLTSASGRQSIARLVRDVFTKEPDGSITQQNMATTDVHAAQTVATRIGHIEPTTSVCKTVLPIVDRVAHISDGTEGAHPRRVVRVLAGGCASTGPVHVLEYHDGVGGSIGDVSQLRRAAIVEHAIGVPDVIVAVTIHPRRSGV